MSEETREPAWWRASEYWLLVAVALASAAGLAWWITAPLGVAGLSISALPKYLALWPRTVAVGAEKEWWKTVGLSALNSAGATAAAVALGGAVRWLFW